MRRPDSPAAALLLSVAAGSAQSASLSPEEQLGRFIFFDADLSINRNQSCATCHAPELGWTGPDGSINAGGAVYEGSSRGRFAERKPPSSAYATQSPVLRRNKVEGTFVGGNFWDGRATGEALGSPAADQAWGPFLNPLEHGLATPADVMERVCAASCGSLFRKIWVEAACDLRNADGGFKHVARPIAPYEASPESNAFTSRYDEWLRRTAVLTRQEQQGRALFRMRHSDFQSASSRSRPVVRSASSSREMKRGPRLGRWSPVWCPRPWPKPGSLFRRTTSTRKSPAYGAVVRTSREPGHVDAIAGDGLVRAAVAAKAAAFSVREGEGRWGDRRGTGNPAPQRRR